LASRSLDFPGASRRSRRADQLRREVAREIAHPNVCRTYDIASVDGHVFS
jgi:hypothetical protein